MCNLVQKKTIKVISFRFTRFSQEGIYRVAQGQDELDKHRRPSFERGPTLSLINYANTSILLL